MPTMDDVVQPDVSPWEPDVPPVTDADMPPDVREIGAVGDEPNVWPEELGEEAYHGPAGDFVRLVEPHTEADPAALLVQFLVAAGSAIGAGPHLRVGGDRHPGRLYAVCVGRSSRGRKGTAWSWARQVVVGADPAWRDRVASGLSSGEGVIWAVRDSIEQWKTPKGTRLNRDPAPELVVTDPGVDDKRLLVVEGEFSQALRVAERVGNTLSATLRNAWDLAPDGVLQSLVKNSPGKSTGAHVSVIGHVTASELRRYLTGTEGANGYANRFLWVAVRRSKLLPDGGVPRHEDIDSFNSFLSSRLSKSKKLGAMQRTAEAADMWRAVYGVLSTEDDEGLVGAVTARSEAQVTRLSLLYALLDGRAEIDTVHLQAALEVWRYAEDSCKYIFGDASGDPIADEILRALRAASDGLTRTEISGLFHRNVASGRLEEALKGLARAGKAACQKSAEGKGRPSERWRAGVSRDERNESNEETSGVQRGRA